jgi:squalene-associated FAD-dependent desaturase
MAGLAAAVEIVHAGRSVTVHEAAPRAGGRCRSFFDETLGCVIDNGNHLILGANPAVFAYLARIGASGGLMSQAPAAFPFADLASGERWTVRPNKSRIPWWIFSNARRVPGSRWTHYLAGLKFAFAGRHATVAECLKGAGPLVSKLWEPLTVAVLNTSLEEGSARLLWPVLRLTFGKGEAACRAYVARDGLGPNLVDPATKFVEAKDGSISYGERLRSLKIEGGRIASLDFGGEPVEIAPGDAVILAVPPAIAHQLLPDLPTPLETRAIVNAHFRLSAPAALPEGSHVLGLVGGTAQWLFARGDIVSVTVSAADALAEKSAEEIAELLWRDVASALEMQSAPRPPVRIVKEKRATFAQTPAALDQRAGTRTAYDNLFLAGDWTDTGLPATIEGAIRSGNKAAKAALAR